jgi:hypothetical protein
VNFAFYEKTVGKILPFFLVKNEYEAYRRDYF